MNNELKAYALAFTAVLILGTARIASAGDYEDGFNAFRRGDTSTALKLLTPLATQGQVESQTMIGLIYHDGNGVNQNYAEAAKWLRRAANQKDRTAAASLGFMYLEGRGVPQDTEEAGKLIGLAAALGEQRAQGFVGAMYRENKDYVEAVNWLRSASSQGEAPAQRILGEMYRDGQGFRQDSIEAYRWFSIAAANGDDPAKTFRKELEGKLTSAQLVEAKRKAALWKPEKSIASNSQSSIANTSNPVLRLSDGYKIIKFSEDADTTLERKKRESASLNKEYLFKGTIIDIKAENEIVVQLGSGHFANVYLINEIGSTLRKNQEITFKGILSFVGTGTVIRHSIKNAMPIQ